MKGSLDAAVGWLPAIIFLFICIGVALFFFYFVTKEPLGDVINLPGTEDESGGFTTVKENALGVLKYVTDYLDRYTGDYCGDSGSGPCQPSEVACSIATGISNDFISRGFSGSRDIGGGKNCEDTNCLVDVRAFELQNGVIDPGDWDTKLSDPYVCNFCQEGGSAIPLLDDICVNYNLKDKQIGGNYICSDPFADPTGGGIVSFGNNVCVKPNSNSNWNDNCDGQNNDGIDDFCDGCCDNGKDNIKWLGDSVGGNSGNSLQNNQQYIYGVVWYPTDKQYYVHFEKIEEGTTDSNFNFVTDVLTNNRKNSIIGNWYEEAREVYRSTVTVASGNAISLSDLRDNIGIETFTEFCISQKDCFDTEPVEMTGFWITQYAFKPVTIKIGGGIGINGELEEGKTYEVSIKNWYNPIGIMFDKIDKTVSIWCTDC